MEMKEGEKVTVDKENEDVVQKRRPSAENCLIVVGDIPQGTNSGKESLQDSFKKFREQKIREHQMMKMTREAALKGGRTEEFKAVLRQKFIDGAKRYLGVPYHIRYKKEEDPVAPLYLDCCGLVRKVLQDLQEDFGFIIGKWNQAYQMDTLPIVLKPEELKPGDLVFYEGTYNSDRAKSQKHDNVHVEIFLGGETGEATIGSRYHRGNVSIFPSYKFNSTSWNLKQYHFRSLETWLNGECVSHCPEHEWRCDSLNYVEAAGKRSIFSAEANLQEQEEEDINAGGLFDEERDTSMDEGTAPDCSDGADAEASSGGGENSVEGLVQIAGSEGMDADRDANAGSGEADSEVLLESSSAKELPTEEKPSGKSAGSAVTLAAATRSATAATTASARRATMPTKPGSKPSGASPPTSLKAGSRAAAAAAAQANRSAKSSKSDAEGTAGAGAVAGAAGSTKSARPKRISQYSTSNSSNKMMQNASSDSEKQKDGGGNSGSSSSSGSSKREVSKSLTEVDFKSIKANMSKTYYVSKTNGWKLVKKALDARGWSQLPFDYQFSTRFGLKWVERRVSIDYVAHTPGQLVCHIPNNDVITTKIGLLSTLRDKFCRVAPGTAVRPQAPWLPHTYDLECPADRKALLAEEQRLLEAGDGSEGGIWIYKPSCNNRGRGIRVVKGMAQLQELCFGQPMGVGASNGSSKDADDTTSAGNSSTTLPYKGIVQKYLTKPLLVTDDGCKFDIRCYLLIARNHPTTLAFYRPGYCRLALKPYSLEDIDDACVHLTNASVQKKDNPSYADYKEIQCQSVEAIAADLERRGRTDSAEFVRKELDTQIKACLVDVLRACNHIFLRKHGYFDLLGCDFMITDDNKVKLLEINTNPALTLDNSTLKELLPRVVDGAVELVLKSQGPDRRPTDGDDFLKEPLPEGFVLIYDEATRFMFKRKKPKRKSSKCDIPSSASATATRADDDDSDTAEGHAADGSEADEEQEPDGAQDTSLVVEDAATFAASIPAGIADVEK